MGKGREKYKRTGQKLAPAQGKQINNKPKKSTTPTSTSFIVGKSPGSIGLISGDTVINRGVGKTRENVR